MNIEIYKEDQFYNDGGSPTESFRYSRYRLNQNGEDYDEFALVTNAQYPYIRLAKMRGGNYYPCGSCSSPATDGGFAMLTDEKRDELCPKMAWGFVAEFLVNLRYSWEQDDYILLKPKGELIQNYYNRYLHQYLDSHNGLKYSGLTDIQKELDFIAEHKVISRALWQRSEPLKAYAQLYEYAQSAEEDYERYMEERKCELQDLSLTSCIDKTTDTYHQILSAINSVGRSLERYPRVVQSHNEENIRFMFLAQLDAVFPTFSTTGETFNHKGKTDILVKQNGEVIFIAECKIWKGEKAFQEAIDQLLSYLTWEDRMTALLIFVKNTCISTVYNAIQESIVKHRLYISKENISGVNYMSYKFRLPQDAGKIVQVAIQVFDFN